MATSSSWAEHLKPFHILFSLSHSTSDVSASPVGSTFKIWVRLWPHLAPHPASCHLRGHRPRSWIIGASLLAPLAIALVAESVVSMQRPEWSFSNRSQIMCFNASTSLGVKAFHSAQAPWDTPTPSPPLCPLSSVVGTPTFSKPELSYLRAFEIAFICPAHLFPLSHMASSQFSQVFFSMRPL